MIDKILPCPECGSYPDFETAYCPITGTYNLNKYDGVLPCYCEHPNEFFGKQDSIDLIGLISRWNEFCGEK